MVDIDKWLGYFTISIVMIVGILLVTGMVGALNWQVRLLAGILVFSYVIFRIYGMYSRRKRSLDSGKLSAGQNHGKVDNSDPNNT